MPKSFFAWDDMLNMNKIGFFPYTPATQMLHGLVVGIEMLHEEGLDNVFARHDRLAEATRRAVKAWGLENLNKNASQHLADHHRDPAAGGPRRRQVPRAGARHFNISYGASFGPYAGKYFRIGHLGDINDGTLIGALGITEMALALAGIPHKKGGVQAAIDYIVSAHAGREARRGGIALQSVADAGHCRARPGIHDEARRGYRLFCSDREIKRGCPAKPGMTGRGWMRRLSLVLAALLAAQSPRPPTPRPTPTGRSG